MVDPECVLLKSYQVVPIRSLLYDPVVFFGKGAGQQELAKVMEQAGKVGFGRVGEVYRFRKRF